MTKCIHHITAAVVLLLLAAPAAALADTLPRTFAYRVVSVEQRYEWTEQSKGYPEKCESWIKGGGVLTSTVPGYSGLLKLDEYYPGKIYGLSSKGSHGTVERRLDYRGHLQQEISDCTPCGPLSEYGECRPERPDTLVRQSCGPKRAATGTALGAANRALTFAVSLGFEDALKSCPEPGDSADPGPSSPDFGKMRAEGATRKLLSLARGERHTVVFESKVGRCDRLGRTGSHQCATAKATVNFRRSS